VIHNVEVNDGVPSPTGTEGGHVLLEEGAFDTPSRKPEGLELEDSSVQDNLEHWLQNHTSDGKKFEAERRVK